MDYIRGEIALFHRNSKKPIATKSRKNLIKIESAAILLAEKKRAQLLIQIKQLSSFDASPYENLCHSLLLQVALYCQNLPETSSYYAGGLLDFILNRTEAALQLFRQFLSQGEEAEPSEEQKLWLYALFSAGCLQGLGKLVVDYQIDLFGSQGQPLKQWQPLLENMLDVGQYYQYTLTQHKDDALRRRINLLLAKQLMPTKGFTWLLSNLDVFAVWLALLDEDEDGAGALGAILNRAKSLALQRGFNELPIKAFGGGAGGSEISPRSTLSFIDTKPLDSPQNNERFIGIQFIRWLTAAIASGKIVVNQLPLFVAIPGGLMMSQKLFEMFIKHNPGYKNWRAVQQAFLSIGIHRTTNDSQVISRFEDQNHEQMLSGIVIDNCILPDNVPVFDHQTQQVSVIPAIELIRIAQTGFYQSKAEMPSVKALPQLSEKGQWKAATEPKISTLKSGMTQRV